MKTFVQELSAHIQADLEKGKDLVFVSPSKRLFSFVRKELTETLSGQTPYLLPLSLSPNECFNLLEPHQGLSTFDAIVRLFLIQKEHFKEPTETFSEFYHLGKTILSDFNDVDQYLVNAKTLFTNIEAIQEIENWSFNNSEKSENQLRFLSLYHDLNTLYEKFVAWQKENNSFTTGQHNRQLAEHGFALPANLKNKKWIVAGLNAISKAEMAIYQQLQQVADVEFFWDLDPYLLESKTWDANWFIHQNKSQLGGKVLPTTSATTLEKKFQIIQFPEKASMHTWAGNQLVPESEEKTSVVLMEEDCVPFVLNGIPAPSKVNLTMGMPLEKTSVYSLFRQTLQLVTLLNRKQHLKFSEIAGWIKQPLFELFWDAPQDEALIQQLSSGYLKIKDTVSGLDCIQFILTQAKADSANQFLSAFLTITQSFRHENPVLQEGTLGLVSYIKEVRDALTSNGLDLPLQGLLYIAKSFIKDEEIDLVGEPFTDHQILGLLETRGLDFKKVIFCGINESLLPGNRFSDSLIPMELRSYHKLPGKKEKDAVFAYYFFKLICSSESCQLLYLSEATINRNDEKSRYLNQLEYLCSSLPKWSCEHTAMSLPTGSTVSAPKIGTDAQFISQLEAILEKGISPSTINLFFTSPLNFLLQKVMRLGDDDMEKEKLDPRDFGSFIHQCLEKVYTPLKNKVLTSETYTERLLALPEIIQEQVHATFHSSTTKLLGSKRLAIELSTDIINNLTDFEKRALKNKRNELTTILELEYKVSRELEFGGKTWTIHGEIDRVDRIGNRLRLLDYKTGKESLAKVLNFEEEILLSPDSKKNVLRQLLIYGWMMLPYCREHQLELELGVFSFKQSHAGFQWRAVDLDVVEEMGNFLISQFLDQVLNPELVFEHNEATLDYVKLI